MANLSPPLRQRFFTVNGVPLVGGKIWTYAAGTNTPMATYVDQTEDTPNTNPIILDASGEADIWLGQDAYKFVVMNAADEIQFTTDGVIFLDNESITTPKIANDAVTEAKLADDAVSTEKIVDFAVTSEKIGLQEVKTANIEDEAITTGKIEDEAVTTAKIDDAAVTKAKLSSPNVVMSSVKAADQDVEPIDGEVDVTDWSLTINTTGTRPVWLGLCSQYTASTTPAPDEGSFIMYCDGKNAKEQSSTETVSEPHSHQVDAASDAAFTAFIQIRREVTILSVTSYKTVHQGFISMRAPTLNSVPLETALPVSAINFLDTDFTDTVGAAKKYRVYVRVYNSGFFTTGATLIVPKNVVLKAIEH